METFVFRRNLSTTLASALDSMGKGGEKERKRENVRDKEREKDIFNYKKSDIPISFPVSDGCGSSETVTHIFHQPPETHPSPHFTFHCNLQSSSGKQTDSMCVSGVVVLKRCSLCIKMML